tara:strand:- start:60 stop:239 length:180 start_codon:yes stop_codon:yes gene_type:complete
MKIENAKYVRNYQTEENCAINCIVDGVHVSVPIGIEGNRHYAEILRQVEAGDLTIAAAD